MNEQLISKLLKYGCKVEDTFFHTVHNIDKNIMYRVRNILESVGYEIVEPRSSETTLAYQTTPQFYKMIAEKYDLNDTFQAIECFAEISQQNETSKMGDGAVFSQYDEDCGFHMSIDFENHKVATLHFGDERVIEDYNGKKCFIDEINCSKIEKSILETIWTLEEDRERIRNIEYKNAPKKVVEYRKLLKKWDNVLKVISKDWKQSTLVFGKRYAIERDIEHWQEVIRRETAKLII